MLYSNYVTLSYTETPICTYFISFIFNNSANIIIPAAQTANSSSL